MSPKALKKVKKEATPEPPPKPKQVTPKKVSPSKKPKESPQYSNVDKEAGCAIPVDIRYEGTAPQAKPGKKGGFEQTLKLSASDAFSISKTLVFPDGHEYAGYQAILLHPAKSFAFLKLPEEAKNRVYKFYLAPKGIVGEPISLDGKRASKDVFSKSYADGMKNRLGLLTVCKEIKDQALPILYDHVIRLESTSTLMDFLTGLPSTTRLHLIKVEVKNYIKSTARITLHLLRECRNLETLRFDNGVVNDASDLAKAVKVFYADAYKFLEAMGAAKGDKVAGVAVLQFGQMALVRKAKAAEKRTPWRADEVEQFRQELLEKLNSLQWTPWVCICGSIIKGHTCLLEFQRRSDTWSATAGDPQGTEVAAAV